MKISISSSYSSLASTLLLVGSSLLQSTTNALGLTTNATQPSSGSSAGPWTLTAPINNFPISYKTGASMQGLINTHIIFYGSSTSNYFTTTNKAIVQNFLANLYGSSWYAVAMNYGVGRVALGQSVQIDCSTNALTCTINPDKVASLIFAQMPTTLPMDTHALYLVVAAPEVTEKTSNGLQQLGTDYCGYHGYFYSIINDKFIFAVVGVPSGTSAKCGGAPVGAIGPNGDVRMDLTIPVIAHELIEAIISPIAMQTWTDASNLEALDKCQNVKSATTSTSTTYQYNVVLNGFKYVLPMIWDPQSQSCSLGTTFVSEWSSVGCFTNSIGSSHTLHYISTSSTSMTVEVCQAACMKAGYLYAGVQYGQECWCDNIMAVTAAPSTSCTMPCPGYPAGVISAGKCGGPSLINVYKLPVNNKRTPSPYLGCYNTAAFTTSFISSSSPVQTIELCRLTCANSLFYGVSGNSCYCGNAFPSTGVTTLASTACNVKCSGNPNEICGATSTAISVYGPSNTWKYAGCYSDLDGNNRALSYLLTTDNYVNSIEFCQTQCAANGYSFAGLENGNQCFCGNSISTVSSKRMPDQSCKARTTLCTGNTAEFCGSASMIDIYTSSTTFTAPSAPPNPTTWTNLGCISQSIFTDVRSFTNEFYNTIELCQSQCNIVGYKYAGLVYGKECHCYNTVPTTLTAATGRCTMTCTGSASETCGGPNAVQLYSH